MMNCHLCVHVLIGNYGQRTLEFIYQLNNKGNVLVLIVVKNMFCNSLKLSTRTICIVRLSALGDVLMLVPLIRTLQANLPHLETITWVISRPSHALVAGLAGVEFIVIDKPTSLLDYWRFKRRMHNRKFDVLLATQASLRANLLYPWIHARLKIGYDHLRAKDGHAYMIDQAIQPGQDH